MHLMFCTKTLMTQMTFLCNFFFFTNKSSTSIFSPLFEKLVHNYMFYQVCARTMLMAACVLPGVCQDCVNGRLWSYNSSHIIGEWVAGGYPSSNQVSEQLKTSPGSQSAG